MEQKTTQLIYSKMADIMRDIGVIGKDQKNAAQGFKFRGIDQFVNTLYPALVKHKVFMSPKCVHFHNELKDVERANGKKAVDKHVSIMMQYDFYAEDGSKVTVGPVPAEGLDGGDKATNKAISAALKYALIQTFSIPTEDMAEADKDSPEITPTYKEGAKKLPTADELISAVEANAAKVVEPLVATTPVKKASGWGSRKKALNGAVAQEDVF